MEVVYPEPGPYARRKDTTLRGSFSFVPMGVPHGAYGADPAPRRPAPKPVGEAIKSFFTKDGSGTSKAEKVAKRAIDIAVPPPPRPAPAPAPVVVHAPPAPAPSTSPVQLALVGLVAAGVGFGVGYLVAARKTR